jgi:hypothetical protein
MSRRNLPAAAKRTVSVSPGEDPGQSGRIRRKNAFSGALRVQRTLPVARIARFLRIGGKPYRLCGGEGGFESSRPFGIR